jgi:hypothetical protein
VGVARAPRSGWGMGAISPGIADWGSLQGPLRASAAADPFQSVGAVPEIIEEYLEQGTATCIAFNRRGTLLAGARRSPGAGRAAQLRQRGGRL